MSEVAPRLLSQRYVITEPLGEGGMAVVWHGYDRQQNIWCAVKILRERYAQQDRALRRFLDEGQVMLRLGHRNVIDAWDLVRTEEPFLVMEIAEGGSLKDWVDRHGSMPPRLAVDVAIQISKGIGAAHKIGVIHRDIKPHNILLNRRGQCKVTDFGIARILRPDGSTDVPDAATGTQNAMGTLGYMAPEQRTDPRSADVRTDVYGIGATMYTLLTGRVVTNLFIAEREPELLEGIPVVLVPILMRATGYKPDQRYETVQDLAKALFDVRPMLPEAPVDTPPLAPDLPPEAPPPPTPGPVESRAVQPSGAPALPPSLRTRTLSSPPAVSRMLTPPPAEFRSGLPAHVDGDDSIDLPEPRTRWWVVASSLSLLLVLFLVLDAFYVRTASSAAWQARAHLLHVAEREAAVIDKLARMGADRSSLERQFQQMATTSDPEQAVVAGETFASALRTAADEHVGSQKGKDWHDAMNAIASIEQAQDLLEARVEDWRRRAEGLGLPAVVVRIAPRPKAVPDST